MKQLKFETAQERANTTSYIASLEHKLSEIKAELDEAKKTALDYMDSQGLKTLSAGGRTWKVINRSPARLDKAKVEAYCASVGKDVAELKSVAPQHYFQLCK